MSLDGSAPTSSDWRWSCGVTISRAFVRGTVMAFLPRSRPPADRPEWSAVIMIVAVLFLGAVLAFYYFVR